MRTGFIYHLEVYNEKIIDFTNCACNSVYACRVRKYLCHLFMEEIMKVRVVTEHFGEGQFPTFTKDTKVVPKEACKHFLNWYSCDNQWYEPRSKLRPHSHSKLRGITPGEIEEYQTYVPGIFVVDGALIRDYNPTELIQKTGDILEVQEIVYAWLIAANENGIVGWIPAEKVVSTNN